MLMPGGATCFIINLTQIWFDSAVTCVSCVLFGRWCVHGVQFFTCFTTDVLHGAVVAQLAAFASAVHCVSSSQLDPMHACGSTQ